MIANITRGANPGNIGAYLHGPGTANEHTYMQGGKTHVGGVVIGGNLHLNGDAMPDFWVKEMRAAMRTRPEIGNPIWHVSLRNTANDRTLSNDQWADAGQTFAERMGFADHPWVMIRHGDDHVHLVVSRVSDLGEVWHGRHDRRNAQRACTSLETEYGLETAPRRRQQAAKQSVTTVREKLRSQATELSQERAKVEELQQVYKRMGLMSKDRRWKTQDPTVKPQQRPVASPQRVTRERDQDRGLER